MVLGGASFAEGWQLRLRECGAGVEMGKCHRIGKALRFLPSPLGVGAPGALLIFGVGRRCPGISRQARLGAGPVPAIPGRGGDDTGGEPGPSLPRARPLLSSSPRLPSCALRRRRRCSPRSSWRWRPPQEPQVGRSRPLRRGEGGPGGRGEEKGEPGPHLRGVCVGGDLGTAPAPPRGASEAAPSRPGPRRVPPPVPG